MTIPSNPKELADLFWASSPWTQEEIDSLTRFVNKEQLANIILGFDKQDLLRICLTSIGMRAAVESIFKTSDVRLMEEIIADELAWLIDSLTEKLANVDDKLKT
jgi:hypothetical protein